VLSVAAFLISIVLTKPATIVTRMFVAVFTIPPHAAIELFEYWRQVGNRRRLMGWTKTRLPHESRARLRQI
jgi:hypothetical protein